jgi:DNA-directed RNA polymerase subunit E'/Rpb7
VPTKIYDEPTEVEAVEGVVVLDGPDGVAVLMTPDAALTTSHRLLDGAVTAQGQRVEAERQKRHLDPDRIVRDDE